MKKIIIFFVLLTAGISSFSQNMPSSSLTTDYLKKSRGQNTAAWFLLGGGTTMTMVGMVVGLNKGLAGLGTTENESTTVEDALAITGLAAMAASIPFFIAASKNKKKANTISALFKIEQQPSVLQGVVIRTPYPALALKVRL